MAPTKRNIYTLNDRHSQCLDIRTFFQFLKKGKGDLPPSPSSYAPVLAYNH